MEIPTNKSAQTAEILREAIVRGDFQGHLPSERALSEKLLIRRNCQRDALSILTREGMISAAQKSKRREILVAVGVVKQGVKRCVVLSPKSEYESPALFVEQMGKLRYLLSVSKISVEVVSLANLNVDDPGDQLEQIVTNFSNSVFVLHQLPESVQRWFSESKISSVVFGSLFKDVELPNVEVDFRSAVRHAAHSLIRLKHKRLAIVVAKTRLAGGDQALLGLNDAVSERSGDVLDPYVLRHDFNVPRLCQELDKMMSLSEPPTGLIVQNHHHFLSVYSHLLRKGIHIPNQLSIISMVDDGALRCLSPCPNRYAVGERHLKALANKVLSVNQVTRSSAKIIPEPLPGETLTELFE